MRIAAEMVHPGLFVRQEREARCWSQTQLATRMGRTQRTVSYLETGQRGLSLRTCQGLATAFGTSIELWANLQGAYDLAMCQKALAHDGQVSE